ncbi:MAG: PQQ-binding-like beta-propeller repeat protein [Thermaerobacter sp.]|nr:PQQ-binding-like beta-propeller repeat protein [Thermaerobacter sp.]
MYRWKPSWWLIAVVGGMGVVWGHPWGRALWPSATPTVSVKRTHHAVPKYALWRGSAKTPFTGAIYIADEAGNRILKVNAQKQVLWVAHVPAPDDVNPVVGGPLIVNADARQEVYAVSPQTGKIGWHYGHAGIAGAQPGYLYIPEDSYGMPHHRVMITDPGNERAILVNQRTQKILWQYGQTGVEGFGSGDLYWTNNAVPLSNGTTLITDGAPAGYPQRVLDVNRAGHIRWSITLPSVIHYPSDAMPVGPHLYALADYHTPGGLYVVNRQGRIVWSYRVTSGPGELRHASSMNRLPNGNFLVSDDHNDRVVVIDPRTHRIVWQYGTTGIPGTGPDQLMGNTDAKAVGEPLPPFVPWEGYPH